MNELRNHEIPLDVPDIIEIVLNESDSEIDIPLNVVSENLKSSDIDNVKNVLFDGFNFKFSIQPLLYLQSLSSLQLLT